MIDLGSNSTRLLVAEVDAGDVVELERRTEITRLGQGVDATGRLADEAMERVLAVVADYCAVIERLGPVDRVAAVATSAVRDSDNGDAFAAELGRRFGLAARTISGDEEAAYTFLGATSRHRGDDGETLVIDIGGGSTELVVGRPGAEPDFHVSTQAGSVRQTERHLRADPPARSQLRALRAEVASTIESAVPASVRAAVGRGIAVAGTATSLAALEQRLDAYDRERVDGYTLRRDSCERLLELLAGCSLDQRRELRGLDPKRAPTIVAGAAILVEALAAFDLRQVLTSEADILQGVALAPRDIPV